jgi:hypothetical protein
MEIDIKLEGLDEIIKRLDGRAVGSAVAYTLNNAASVGKTYLAKEITSEYNIKAADVKSRMKVVFKASANALYAIFSVKNIGIPLIQFGAKQAGFKITSSGPKGKKVKGLARTTRRMGDVTVQVKKTGGRKVVNIDPRAFIQKMKSGHLGVFHRLGKERKPIKELWSIGPAKAARTKKISDGIKKCMINNFKDNILKNIAYFQGKSFKG